MRQIGLQLWEKDNPLRQNLIDKRHKTADEVAKWVVDISGYSGRKSKKSTWSRPSTNYYAELFRQRRACFNRSGLFLLDRQVAKLTQNFENKGGFTERFYRVRKNKR